MENVRKRASLFINARSAEELVFVRGTTEGINLVANSWGNSNVRAGDNIIISQMELENVRKRASLFINARSAEELVFVRGTTEGINLVANSWGNSNVRAGDNIIISQMEHHANIVPWQMLCARVGAELRVIPLNPDRCFVHALAQSCV